VHAGLRSVFVEHSGGRDTKHSPDNSTTALLTIADVAYLLCIVNEVTQTGKTKAKPPNAVEAVVHVKM
jgi:hypothetical protein